MIEFLGIFLVGVLFGYAIRRASEKPSVLRPAHFEYTIGPTVPKTVPRPSGTLLVDTKTVAKKKKG